MGLLKTLLDAVRRIRAKKQPAPWTAANFDVPPDDIEFLQEVGLGPEDVDEPYAVPERTQIPAIPPETLDLLRSGAWVGVASSNVDSWRFDEKAGAIEVQFLSGSIYRFGNCGLTEVIQFSASPSPGRYVWYVFRANSSPPDPVWGSRGSGRYTVTKVREPNRSNRINPQTGRGYIVFGPRKAWRFRRKSTGKTLRSPKRKWP